MRCEECYLSERCPAEAKGKCVLEEEFEALSRALSAEEMIVLAKPVLKVTKLLLELWKG